MFINIYTRIDSYCNTHALLHNGMALNFISIPLRLRNIYNRSFTYIQSSSNLLLIVNSKPSDVTACDIRVQLRIRSW